MHKWDKNVFILIKETTFYRIPNIEKRTLSKAYLNFFLKTFSEHRKAKCLTFK